MSHWTEELFQEHPELFLGAFEVREEQSRQEVDGLLKSLARQGFEPSRVLDLNCGVGRHSVELAKRGIHVTGTDISPDYIARARKKAEEAGVSDKTDFRVADMRRIVALKSAEPLDGVLCLWTSFGFYDDETNVGVLRQCRELVRDGGFLALDIINRDWLLENYQEQGYTRWQNRLVLEERHYNSLESRLYSSWTFLKQDAGDKFSREETIKLDHGVWSLHELVRLITEAGWRFKAAYGGFSEGLLASDDGFVAPVSDILQSRMLLVIGC